jgi:hypothetical protein
MGNFLRNLTIYGIQQNFTKLRPFSFSIFCREIVMIKEV